MSESTTNGKDVIGPVLGRIPSGVFILTATDGNGMETGMLASWVQQASFDPPQITVAVNSSRYLNDWLTSSPTAVVNIVAQDDRVLLKHFGKGFDPDAAAFDGIAITRSPTGIPVLRDALGYLECRVIGNLKAGDHVIYLMEITSAGDGPAADAKPMVHVRKNGFNY